MTTATDNYAIRVFDHPALSAVCDAVEPTDNLGFIAAMKRTCKALNGVGLAAPQIGVLKRAVFIMPSGRGRCYTMLNPRIVRYSDATESGEEGCLSYPGTRVAVERWKWIEAEYFDFEWRWRSLYASGWEARVIQHEVDHLLGVCRVGDEWRRLRS